MTLTGFFTSVLDVINVVIIFMVALAVATFIWGLIRRFNAAGDPRKIRDSYFYLIVGVASFAVISSVWALTIFLSGLLGISVTGIPQFMSSAPVSSGNPTGPGSCENYTDPKMQQDCELGLITPGLPQPQLPMGPLPQPTPYNNPKNNFTGTTYQQGTTYDQGTSASGTTYDQGTEYDSGTSMDGSTSAGPGTTVKPGTTLPQ